ncbi:hypothetical protein AGMMS49944_01720 [Spirochaetia bacterium]|nr:hypothetical protein AGMMS49944_01720 [Spirochaetia bacterium]
MNKWFENASKNLLENSIEKVDFLKAKIEWYFNEEIIDNNDEYDIDEERPSCELCEHENLRWQFVIKNRFNNNELKVGSTCITKFDIAFIDKNGLTHIGEDRDKAIEKNINEKIKMALFNNVLEALRTLWRKEKTITIREIIEKAAKQWKEKNAFSPKMLSFIITKFENNNIAYSKLDLKVNLRKNIYKEQMEELENWNYVKIRPFLSEKQRGDWDLHFKHFGKPGTDSKNHHFLPRSILKNFAFNDRAQIYVFDKKIQICYVSSVEKAGSENNYNTVNINGEHLNCEDIFNGFDNRVAIVISKIINNENLYCLTDDEYDFLYHIVAIQIQRTPIMRSTYATVTKKMFPLAKQVYYAETGKNLSEEDYTKYFTPDENEKKRLSIKAIIEPDTAIYNAIVSHPIILMRSQNDNLFTSDNSVIYNSLAPYETPSLSGPSTEIDFPISSKLALSFVPKIIAQSMNNQFENLICSSMDSEYRNVARAIKERTCIDLQHDNILYLNDGQMKSAKRFIYSKQPIDKYFIDEIGTFPQFEVRDSMIYPGEGLPPNKLIRNGKVLVFCIDDFYYDFDIGSVP